MTTRTVAVLSVWCALWASFHVVSSDAFALSPITTSSSTVLSSLSLRRGFGPLTVLYQQRIIYPDSNTNDPWDTIGRRRSSNNPFSFVQVQDEQAASSSSFFGMAGDDDVDIDDDDADLWTPRVGLPGDMIKGEVVDNKSAEEIKHRFENFTPDWAHMAFHTPAESWAVGGVPGPPPESMFLSAEADRIKSMMQKQPEQPEQEQPQAITPPLPVMPQPHQQQPAIAQQAMPQPAIAQQQPAIVYHEQQQHQPTVPQPAIAQQPQPAVVPHPQPASAQHQHPNVETMPPFTTQSLKESSKFGW